MAQLHKREGPHETAPLPKLRLIQYLSPCQFLITICKMPKNHDGRVPPSKTPNQSSYRKNLRVRTYNYQGNGYYFITICTRQRKPLFASGEAKSRVQEKFKQIEQYYPGVSLDTVVIMPNHIHVILVFQSSRKSLGQVIQAFKSWVTRDWGMGHSVWQPNYYEHVIRNDRALHHIREYVVNNPLIDQIDCKGFYEL